LLLQTARNRFVPTTQYTSVSGWNKRNVGHKPQAVQQLREYSRRFSDLKP
jgi:hypothetical protein